jgi:hypothetical protein
LKLLFDPSLDHVRGNSSNTRAHFEAEAGKPVCQHNILAAWQKTEEGNPVIHIEIRPSAGPDGALVESRKIPRYMVFHVPDLIHTLPAEVVIRI